MAIRPLLELLKGEGNVVASNDSETSSDGTRRLGLAATVLARALVAVYLVFVALQWSDIDVKSITWFRRQEFLTGLQALTLTAVGALLGTTVQRQATRQAENRAQRAEEASNRNARDAEKRRALQRNIEGRRAAAAASADDVTRGPRAAPAGGDLLAELDELARRYDQAE
jgi:hypothetical protein